MYNTLNTTSTKKQTKSRNAFHQPATAQQSDNPRKADSHNGQYPSELSKKVSFYDAIKTVY